MGAIIAELFTLQPLFPGSSEIDEIYRVCSICGVPQPDGSGSGGSTPKNLSRTSSQKGIQEKTSYYDKTAISNRPPRPNLIAGGVWQEGLRLASLMSFKFPNITPTPIAKVVSNASDDAVQIIADMLKYDPHRRPSAAEALEHPWFSDVTDLGIHYDSIELEDSRVSVRTSTVKSTKQPPQQQDIPYNSNTGRASLSQKETSLSSIEKTNYNTNTAKAGSRDLNSREKREMEEELRQMTRRVSSGYIFQENIQQPASIPRLSVSNMNPAQPAAITSNNYIASSSSIKSNKPENEPYFAIPSDRTSIVSSLNVHRQLPSIGGETPLFLPNDDLLLRKSSMNQQTQETRQPQRQSFLEFQARKPSFPGPKEPQGVYRSEPSKNTTDILDSLTKAPPPLTKPLNPAIESAFFTKNPLELGSSQQQQTKLRHANKTGSGTNNQYSFRENGSTSPVKRKSLVGNLNDNPSAGLTSLTQHQPLNSIKNGGIFSGMFQNESIRRRPKGLHGNI